MMFKNLSFSFCSETSFFSVFKVKHTRPNSSICPDGKPTDNQKTIKKYQHPVKPATIKPNISNCSILGFVKDPANICSLSGLFFALFGIRYALQGRYNQAYTFSLISTFLDYMDGWIARHTNGRTRLFNQIGLQLDSLVDIINYGIISVITLLEISQYSAWACVIAFIYLSCCCMRLSYYNVFGLTTVPSGNQYYHGLPLDNNAIMLGILTLIFAQAGWLKGRFVFACALLILSYLNTSALQFPKIGYGIAFILMQILILSLAFFNYLVRKEVWEIH